MILLKRILIQRLEIMRNSRNNADGRRIRYYAMKAEEGILPMADIRRENFEQDVGLSATGEKYGSRAGVGRIKYMR